MQRGNHEFFNSPHGRSSAQPTPDRRREAAPKPGIQVLARPKEEEKKPVVIATRPSASVEVMSREKTGGMNLYKFMLFFWIFSSNNTKNTTITKRTTNRKRDAGLTEANRGWNVF